MHAVVPVSHALILLAACCPVLVCVQDFSSVAEKTGTYTAFDYADIMEHLSKRWKLSERTDLTGEVRSHAAAAQLQASLESLCTQLESLCTQGYAHENAREYRLLGPTLAGRSSSSGVSAVVLAAYAVVQSTYPIAV
jgi:hypothetical protein